MEITICLAGVCALGVIFKYIHLMQLHRATEIKKIKIEKGVRQDDATSSKIFTACLEIFGELSWEEKVLNVNREYLDHLRFTGDIILILRNNRRIARYGQQSEQG